MCAHDVWDSSCWINCRNDGDVFDFMIRSSRSFRWKMSVIDDLTHIYLLWQRRSVGSLLLEVQLTRTVFLNALFIHLHENWKTSTWLISCFSIVGDKVTNNRSTICEKNLKTASAYETDLHDSADFAEGSQRIHLNPFRQIRISRMLTRNKSERQINSRKLAWRQPKDVVKFTSKFKMLLNLLEFRKPLARKKTSSKAFICHNPSVGWSIPSNAFQEISVSTIICGCEH